MRNRAKCRLCNSIIESFHSEDYVHCQCTHIAVYGGDAMRCAALDWHNFIRIDDEGNEIIPKIIDNQVTSANENVIIKEILKEVAEGHTDRRSHLKNTVEAMVEGYEKLPPSAMTAPATNYDILSVLLLFLAFLRDD